MAGHGLLGVVRGLRASSTSGNSFSQILRHMNTNMSTPKVLFVMADYGHDPTETAVPFQAFREASFDISFATETGKTPQCDSKMLTGWTQKLLGADSKAISAYNAMLESASVKSPLAWTSLDFSFEQYNLLFFPGGHEKGVRQVIDSDIVHKHLSSYFPQAKHGSNKAVAAICHGVLVLSETLNHSGKSVIASCNTTTLPNAFESSIFWATRAFLGDYYKTYGVGSENCEDMVRKRLNDQGTQFRRNLSPMPFVVKDASMNLVTARFPPDAQLLAREAIDLVLKRSK